MNEEEIYHLIDLLEINTARLMSGTNTILDDSQKLKAIKYNVALIDKLKGML